MRAMQAAARNDRSHAGTQGPESPIDRFDLLLTAAEAYPALEQAFLEAETEISASFRIFDLSTRLRLPAAREIGETWFDLMVHTLQRGVHVRIAVSDFDPIGAVDLHQICWQSCRKLWAAAELAEGGKLDVIPALHSAAAGPVTRAVLFPAAFARLRQVISDLNALSPDESRRALFHAPHLARYTREEDGRLLPRLRIPDLFPATHHQKLAVFDRRKLYIGGLDLNERRYDTPRHLRAAERTWHDIQAMVEGPVVAAASAHLDGFLAAVAGRRPPPPRAPGFLRTLSRRCRNAPFRLSPRPVVSEIEDAHLRYVGEANRLIYLETQFFRYVPLAQALARRARAVPGLRLIVVLPAAPEDVAFENSSGLDARYGEHQQTRCLSILHDGFGPQRLLVASPVQPRTEDSDGRETLRQAPLIYVHSKVSIFDDRAAILSSANLNGRSMRWDTEAGLDLTRPDHVAALRDRVMGHWLPKGFTSADIDPATAFDRWKALADHNTRVAPPARKGFLVHYDSAPARELAAPVPGVPDEMV